MNNGNLIETAPKDGTELLLWCKSWGCPIKGYWDAESSEWSASKKELSLGGGVIDDPTHWLPLSPEPPPPEDELGITRRGAG